MVVLELIQAYVDRATTVLQGNTLPDTVKLIHANVKHAQAVRPGNPEPGAVELISAYVCKQIYIKTINYKYITGLIEVFEVFEVFKEFYDIQFDHLIKLFNLTFCNIDLYDKIGFKKKINNITTESRKFYKKPILSLSKKKVILTKEQIILIIVSRNS